ncbi:hypothetical protein Y1Q_0009844 [Alligator mississippiensis]|uniref:Uncharacterized protein n=1 Tax=Alligator mississippiensis TaxID=8496 RepID=A0A151MX06_ALLMI|nr:hypothetical protein Y1Q_0009844 [Alligator mississippiensis]
MQSWKSEWSTLPTGLKDKSCQRAGHGVFPIDVWRSNMEVVRPMNSAVWNVFFHNDSCSVSQVSALVSADQEYL